MRAKTGKRLVGAVLAGAFTVGLAAPVFAEGGTPPPPAKCNSGNGNGQETTPDNDCDPGNSGGHNNGGG
jgi:hypothetical protein